MLSLTRLLGIGLLVLLSGCTYNVPAPPTAPPAAPVEKPSSASAAGADIPFINLSGIENIAETTQAGFTKTASGLQYRILREGTGLKPTVSDSVIAHYKGQLTNGKEFDSSYKRGQPTPFPLSGVIGGWTEGLQLVGEGGMIELIIPSELGYKAAGFAPDIPPDATLQFIVELKKIK